ncbi:MAG: cytochrome P450 [Sphingomonadales bacterium]|nr:MAG: cytochrome P450 [Sphingomonadales bacterium]
MTAASNAPTGAVSFMDPAVQQCPYSAYQELRELGPVYQEPSTGFFVVLDHGLCRKIASDTEIFRNDTGIMRGRLRPEVMKIYEESGVVPIQGLVTGDGPDHRFQRALVEKVFTMGRVKKMETYLTQVVDECIEGFIAAGRADLHADLAVKLPLLVIADQLGVPREDLERFRYWTESSAEGTNPILDPDRELELIRIEVEFNNYLLGIAEAYRSEPADVLFSDIVHANVDGRRVTDGELVAMASLLIIAGNETTTNAIGNAFHRLIVEPELQEQLRSEPERIGAFVEESLRYEAPIQGLFRLVSRDTEVAGVSIPQGSILVLRWGAANRDPTVFDEPDRFDPQRGNARSHITFGYGPHFCLGSHLARGEIRISIARMLDRLRNIRFAADDAPVERASTYVVSGYQKQLVEFETR